MIIEKIEMYRLKVPLKRPYKIASAEMKAFDCTIVVLHAQNRQGVGEAMSDVWITDNVEALYYAQKFPELVAVNPQKTFTVGSKGYTIRQEDQIFLNWPNLWLEQMFLQGEVQKLEQLWLGTIMR